nr:MAG TPA: hypothetical protein [Bacteriophage sp.]
MKHEKEWYVCDRCGKEMTFYNERYAHFKTEELEPLREKTIYTAEDLAKQTLPMAIWRKEHEYDLCPKCRKDFERFIRNEEIEK